MRYGLPLIVLAVTWQSCQQCDCSTLEIPSGVKIPGGKKAGQLLVDLTAENKVFADSIELPLEKLDSFLAIRINKKREAPYDTVTVVISADSAATYGVLMNVLRAAKKQSAKVVTRIQD